MLEIFHYLSFLCWVHMMAKNLFDVEIPISTIYSMSHHMGEKLSTRGLGPDGPLISGFNGIIVSLRRHRFCIMTI